MLQLCFALGWALLLWGGQKVEVAGGGQADHVPALVGVGQMGDGAAAGAAHFETATRQGIGPDVIAGAAWVPLPLLVAAALDPIPLNLHDL